MHAPAEPKRMNKYAVILSKDSLNIYSTLKWRSGGAYLCSHVLLSISPFPAASYAHCMSVLYPQTTLLKIYRGVGYVCLELVMVNAGHISPHLRRRTLSGRGLKQVEAGL